MYAKFKKTLHKISTMLCIQVCVKGPPSLIVQDIIFNIFFFIFRE